MTDEKKDTLDTKAVGANSSLEKKDGEKDPALDDELGKSRDAMNEKLDRPGALEVADMDASNELQERRNKVKDQLQEQGTFGDDDGGVFGDDEGGFREMLKDANLSGKHFRFCCSGLLVILVLAGLGFGAWKFLQYRQDRPERVDEVEETDEIQDSSVYGFTDNSLISGMMIGGERNEADLGAELGEELGEALVVKGALAELIADFSDIYNSMQVDVVQLLNQSREREEALEDYKGELNFLLYNGGQNLARLQEENDLLETKFTSVQEHKDTLEEQFFTKLSEFDAYGSTASLDLFIAKAEEVVSLRAQHSARAKLISYYQLVMESMNARIKDINLNEEALIKGIQIVDIAGSDIELIIQESEL